MRWADVDVCMLADGVALRNRCPQGQADRLTHGPRSPAARRAVGVAVGDVLLSAIGTGAWQMAVVVALAVSVAILLDGGAVITTQAAVSATLVATLYLPAAMTGVSRMIDALIGAAIALAVAAVSPSRALAGPEATR